ncbi:oocyte zinc finger protein XlCOF22-like [Euwallacea fornicatus]|uniref:oocyte zinc finger protein XlCOF22-like n=1 Tax=Euwallacea fornicatus TaxID=995702 RepID=UPI00338EE1CE
MDTDLQIRARDFPNICRICLITGDLKPLVDGNLSLIFKAISDIEITPGDLLPTNVCITCSNYLQEIRRFADKCKANNTILKLVLKSEEKEEKLNISDEDIKGIELELEGCEEDIQDNYSYESSFDDDSPDYFPPKTETDKAQEDQPSLKKTRIRRKRNALDTAKPAKPNLRRRKHRTPKREMDTDDEEDNTSNSAIPVCKTCGSTFTSKTKLCSHYKENIDCRPKSFKLYKCEICEKEFSTIRRRNEHMNTHTGETPYICNYCGKGFQLYPAHFKHVYRHRLALGEVEFKPGYMENRVRLNLKCELCPKVFASRSGFANHQLIHQGVKIQYKKRPKKEETGPKLKNYLCNYCAKSFRTKVQLDGHIRGHTGERPFACSFCHKFFKTKAALKTHEMNHLGTTPQRFKCETCNKPFSLKAHYEVHKRTHTGEKPFSCHFCGKCFNYRGTWRIHLRMHTGETPYACPVCGNRYHDKSSLNKHQKKKGHVGEAVKQERLIL